MLNNFIDRIKLSFRKDKELYFSLYEILGFYPHDISYYKLALMHKSIMRRNSKGKPVNNERLEFLGDAVLVLIIGHAVNLVMGFLSIVVHGVRLNIMEFSGQVGVEWSGYKYEPFKKKVVEK